MEVNFAFLCDYAQQGGGKMDALGIGFDTIYAVSVPHKHPIFFTVISIKFTTTETGPKQINMHLIDADGKDILPPLEATINVSSPPPGFMHRNQLIALSLYGVVFPRFGDYSVSWLVGGTELKSIPLKVAPPPPQQVTA